MIIEDCTTILGLWKESKCTKLEWAPNRAEAQNSEKGPLLDLNWNLLA